MPSSLQLQGYMVRSKCDKIGWIYFYPKCQFRLSQCGTVTEKGKLLPLVLLGIMRAVIWKIREKDFHGGKEFPTDPFFEHQLN